MLRVPDAVHRDFLRPSRAAWPKGSHFHAVQTRCVGLLHISGAYGHPLTGRSAHRRTSTQQWRKATRPHSPGTKVRVFTALPFLRYCFHCGMNHSSTTWHALLFVCAVFRNLLSTPACATG